MYFENISGYKIIYEKLKNINPEIKIVLEYLTKPIFDKFPEFALEQKV